MTRSGEGLQRRLAGLTRSLKLLRAAGGLALWVAGCAAVLAGVILALTGASPSLTTHSRLVVTLLVAAGLGFVALTMVPLCLPLRVRVVARLVERRFSDLQDQLLAAVTPVYSASGEPSPLQDALTRRVARRLAGENLLSALDIRGLRRSAFIAAGCVLLALVAAVALPQGLARLITPPEPPVMTPEPVPEPAVKAPDAARVGLVGVTLEIQPPEYTGLERRRLTEGFDSVRVLKGTRVTVRARHTKGSRVAMRIGASDPTRLTSTGREVSYSLTATQALAWSLSARLGDKTALVGPYRIEVYPDRAPRVAIRSPGRNLLVDSLAPVTLKVSARDDFGLAKVSLLYRKRGADSWQSTSLGGGSRELDTSSEWDLSPMNLLPGEAVEYRAMATDNDAVSGAKTATTKTYVIALRKLDAPPPTPREIEQVQEQEQDALAKLKTEAQAFDDQLKTLLDQVKQAGAAGQIPELSKGVLQEAQRRLQLRAQDVREAMARAEQTLSENPLLTDDMVQKVQELHRLMAELMDEDLKRVLGKMAEAMKQLGTKKFAMTLQEARDAQQKFMDKLDRTIEMLRKAKLEAKLDALRNLVERLADRQEALREKTRKLPNGSRADRETLQQTKLAEQTDPLGAQVRDVAEEMVEENERIAGDLRELAAQLEREDPAGQMRRAAGEMHRGSPSRADRPQARAMQSLRDAAAGLAGAAADITAEERQALTGAARKITRDALKLSQQQEQVMSGAQSLASRGRVDVVRQKPALSDLEQRQQAVRRGTNGLASRMQKLAKQTPIIDPGMARRVEEISGLMERAANEIEAGEVLQAYSRQSQTMAELNELAQELMQLSDKVNRTSARMALEEYMKRLEQLAQQQKGLNQQTQDAGGRQAGGQQPMLGQGGPAQLSLEQALIRQALQKLMSGKGAGKLADQLGGAPASMEKVEDALKGGTVTGETVQQQRDILHKMLDAQRSLYSKKKESKERKAEAPKPYQAPPSPPVLRPDQTRPAQTKRDRRDMGREDLPLDFEVITREYLDKVRR